MTKLSYIYMSLSCIFTGYRAVEECIEKFPEHFNLKNDEEQTPLHLAILNNHFHLATYLMEKVQYATIILIMHVDMIYVVLYSS